MPGWFLRLVALFLLSCTLGVSGRPAPEAWVPVRWTGGPLELAWRTRAKTLPADAAVRDALARWYEPATLSLLEHSSANCLLVTWSAPADAAVEAEQQQLVKVYAEAAHKRGLAVLGLVYAAGDASKIAADAARAALDGLVLEGEFAPEFPAALRKAAASMLVVEIAAVEACTDCRRRGSYSTISTTRWRRSRFVWPGSSARLAWKHPRVRRWICRCGNTA